MKRVLSIILVAVMCLAPLSAITVSAADNTNTSATVNNLFELKGYGEPNATEPEGELKSDNAHFIAGNAIAVNEGDVITIAPVVQAQTYQLLTYQNGTSTKVSATTSGVELTLLGDSEESPAIMKYTVPAGVTHIAPVGSQMYEESYTVTKNQALTKEICFGMWSDSAMKMFNNGNTTPAVNLVNLFSDGEGGCGVNMGEAKYNGENGLGTNTNYRGTINAISVTRDDVIYFVGQTPTGSYTGHFISTFKEDGTGIGNLKHAYMSVYANIGNNFVVYAYRAPEGVASVRISSTAANYNAGIILATKNQPFDGATFRTWCSMNKVNCDTLVGTSPDGPSVDLGALTGLYNLFTHKSNGGVGVVNAAAHSNTNKYPDEYDSNTSYWCTEKIAVTTGDVLYFLGDSSIGYHVTLFDKNGNGYGDTDKRIVPADLTVVEKLGSGVYSIYSYTPDAETGYVRISQKAAVYASNCVLLTKNQPFDKAKLNEWCTANGGDLTALVGEELPKVEVDTESPLYKKSALFIGDSITYGLGEERFDPSLPRRAWAGRLAEKYDMTVVNAGDSGARVSLTGSSGHIVDGLGKWEMTTKPDMVVVHGGVNDARYNGEVPIGTVDSDDVLTFCGGLNYIFTIAKKRFPDSDLFYIANFYIPEGKGTVSNMGEYYALAKQICEKHGVTFIDLAGNTELNETLANKNASGTPDWSKYMPDKLHPNAAGYDVITPYIAEALEAFYAPPAEEDPEEKPTETTTLGGDTTTAPTTTAAPAEKKGCGGFTASAVIAVVAVSVFGAAITVIKKK